jgi:hypothetical protein
MTGVDDGDLLNQMEESTEAEVLDPEEILQEQDRGNLIVTGGLGFLGAHTIAELILSPKNHGFKKIVIVDN